MRTYAEARTYLDQFVSYERQLPSKYTSDTLNLDRVLQLLDRLGRPDRAYPVIHIAGTKGKGSTAVLSEAGLRAAGYRTGLYTSPHLHTFRERLRVNGVNISRDAFAHLVDQLAPHIAAVPALTWFEIVTALALQHFAQAAVDVAVLEVGLGGRFDATNVVTPRVSVITPLSMDHMALLGPTVAHIAFEKAGIIKPRVPVVSAPQPPAALDVVRRVARLRSAPLTLIGRDITFGAIDQSREQQRFHVDGAEFSIPLLGAHQIVNAATALTALRVAAAHGLTVSDAAIRAGWAGVQWPGRLETLSRDPLLVVDGAHNGDSAQKLAAALVDVFGQSRWTVIMGMSADKDIPAIVDALCPVAQHVILTRAHSVRAASLEAVQQPVLARGLQPHLAASVSEALDLAQQFATPIVVTGSLFVVADARAAWAAKTDRVLDTDD